MGHSQCTHSGCSQENDLRDPNRDIGPGQDVGFNKPREMSWTCVANRKVYVALQTPDELQSRVADHLSSTPARGRMVDLDSVSSSLYMRVLYVCVCACVHACMCVRGVANTRVRCATMEKATRASVPTVMESTQQHAQARPDRGLRRSGQRHDQCQPIWQCTSAQPRARAPAPAPAMTS